MPIRYNGHTINLNTIKKVRYNGHTVYSSTPAETPLCFTSLQDGSSLSYTITGSLPNIHIQISGDGENWQDWDGTGIAVQQGGRIYVRNTQNTLSTDNSNYFKFVMTGSFASSGSVNSMINYSELSKYCYFYMFNGCTGLTSAPSLPATILTSNCYDSMFHICTGLTSAPSLPATTLAVGCYSYMFSGCTGLTSAPSLPATTLAIRCYHGMFSGCTGLTSAPSLPATTLAIRCYWNMFDDCTGLTSAPSLPATTLAESCYSYMFRGCTGLTSAPSLPATTLANDSCNSMFSGCTNLKVKENDATGGTLFFTCPSLSGLTTPTYNMFYNTGGSFTGTPSSGSRYYWYN